MKEHTAARVAHARWSFFMEVFLRVFAAPWFFLPLTSGLPAVAVKSDRPMMMMMMAIWTSEARSPPVSSPGPRESLVKKVEI